VLALLNLRLRFPAVPFSNRDGGAERLEALARRLRGHSLRMISRARSSHAGSCLSVADIMAVLYGEVLRLDPRRPEWPDRDRLIVSKGHAAAVTYAALAERGFFPLDLLGTYGEDGGAFFGHVTRTSQALGVELSTGSLGHGLPVGAGMALAGKRDGQTWRVFVVLSDGECDEGSNWEAILFAAHHCLDNLVVVVDYNKIQSLDLVANTIALEPLAEKFRAFNWHVGEVDGHSIPDLREALHSVPGAPGRPTAVIAHTIKGKGVSFMEGQVLWHYRPPDSSELDRAFAELQLSK